MIRSGLRHAEVATATQAGDGDLPARSRSGEGRSDHRLSPFGDKSNVAFHRYGATNNACSDIEEGFLFGGFSRFK